MATQYKTRISIEFDQMAIRLYNMETDLKLRLHDIKLLKKERLIIKIEIL